MGISLSGIGTVGKEQLISSCSNGEPNWSYIPTKGKSSKTHAEFVSEIKELARRAATTANRTEYEYISRQVLGLRAEYLSDVAPDRKQLYEQAKNTIKKTNWQFEMQRMWRIIIIGFFGEGRRKKQ